MWTHPAVSPVVLSPLQWSRAQEQLSMKEVVRRSSRGRPVERSGARPSSVSWQGRWWWWWGGWGWLKGGPAAKWPTGASWVNVGRRSGWDWNRTAAGQLRCSARRNIQKTNSSHFMWTIFLISCQYWITVHYPCVIISTVEDTHLKSLLIACCCTVSVDHPLFLQM